MQKKCNKLSDIEVLEMLPVRVDLLLLKDQFSNHKNPRKKIFDLKSKGYLQLIKRGQYFNLRSKELKSVPYETIANSIYYPSYVSLEWALQFYSLILERVTSITSVTTRKSQEFKTPFGYFSFEHLKKSRYPVGYILKQLDSSSSFFIARPEKALMDYIGLRGRDLKLNGAQDIFNFLNDDLRLNIKNFFKIVSLKDLKELLPLYHRNSKEYRILKWLISQIRNSK